MAATWTTQNEHWPHATYQRLPEMHITASFVLTQFMGYLSLGVLCAGQENPWCCCSQSPCLLCSAGYWQCSACCGGASAPLFQGALRSEKSAFYWYPCCCFSKLSQVLILNTCLAKARRLRLLSAHLSFLHPCLAGSATSPGGAPGTRTWGWEMLHILLLMCHFAMLHHVGLSKHFCCSGLCRAGEDLKLLLTAALYPSVSCWVMPFLLHTIAHLNTTEMPSKRVLPFPSRHRKCLHFEESYKMTDWWNSWGRRQGFLSHSATQFLANWSFLPFIITQTAGTCIFPAGFRPPLYYIPYQQRKDIDLILRKYKKNYRKISSHHKHPNG